MDNPIIPRFYIVTYLKEDGNIKVDIINDINKCQINKKESMAMGQWFKKYDEYLLYIYANIYGTKENIKEENRLVRASIPTAITAIRLSDINLIKAYPELDEANIFVKFSSSYDELYTVENWGKLKNYKYIEENSKEYANKDNNNYKEEIKVSNKSDIEEIKLNKHKVIAVDNTLKGENFSQYEAKEVGNISFRKKKDGIRIQEGIILNLLNQHIENKLFVMYGKEIKYCIGEKEIIDIDEVENISSQEKVYEINVIVKMKIKSRDKKAMISFIIHSNKIIIKSVKEY